MHHSLTLAEVLNSVACSNIFHLLSIWSFLLLIILTLLAVSHSGNQTVHTRININYWAWSSKQNLKNNITIFNVVMANRLGRQEDPRQEFKKCIAKRMSSRLSQEWVKAKQGNFSVLRMVSEQSSSVRHNFSLTVTARPRHF